MNQSSDLAKKHCVPCEGGVSRLTPEAVWRQLQQVDGWELAGNKIHKRFEFRDFVAAMGFVNAMADLAEQQGHHPDFCVHYNRVDVTIWTHAIDGLSENDFVLAAKLDQIPR